MDDDLLFDEPTPTFAVAHLLAEMLESSPNVGQLQDIVGLERVEAATILAIKEPHGRRPSS